jgi:phage gp36-like protein
MAYIVAADLIVAFGSSEVIQIGRAVQTAATYDEARVSQAIASASAEADSFICGKYAVPCQMPPEYLTVTGFSPLTDSSGLEQYDSGGFVLMARDPAIQSVLTDSSGAPLWSNDATRTPEVLRQIVLDITRFRLWDNRASEEVLRRYENALRWLRDVAAGRAGIMGPDGVQMPAPDAGNIPDVLGNKPAAVVAYAGKFGDSFEKAFSFGGGW